MKRKFSRAIRKIAKQEGVRPEVVYAEMQQAINMGFNNLDPEVQAYWRRIAPDGTAPSPEKYIEIITREMKSAKTI